MVTPRFHPEVGGIENVVLNLAEGLVKRGHEVKVLTTTSEKEMLGEDVFNDIRIERLRAFSPGNAYTFSSKLGRRVRDIADDYDIIHAHGYHALPALNAYLNRANSRFILSTYYHRYSHNWFRNLLLLPYRAIAKRMVNNANIVICITEAERDLLKIDFEPQDCRVIHVGSEKLKPLNSKKDERNVVIIGRLERYKNIHAGILSISKIEGLMVDIIGTGPETDRLEELVRRKQLVNRVNFHGFLEEPEKNAILSEALCLLTLSDYESFGIVIIEAANFGIDVIASDIPSHREIAEVLEEGVCLVNQNDIDGVADAIRNTIKSEKKNKPRVERFTWDYLVDKYVEAYGDALSSA